MFLLTNGNIGMTPYYEVSSQVLSLCTGLTQKELNEAKMTFQQDKKFKFYKDWVFICNYEKYQSFKGEKNEIAYNRELNTIPEEIKKYCMDRVSATPDTPINVIVNSNSNSNKGGVGGKEVLDDDVFISQLKEKFSDKNIELEIEKMKDWLASNGKQKKDYAAFARNWLRNTKSEKQEEVLIIS